jgi:hypothetical protein
MFVYLRSNTDWRGLEHAAGEIACGGWWPEAVAAVGRCRRSASVRTTASGGGQGIEGRTGGRIAQLELCG